MQYFCNYFPTSFGWLSYSKLRNLFELTMKNLNYFYLFRAWRFSPLLITFR